VDLALILAVIEVESAFQARAVSRAGAIGPMQLMPGTARRYGVDPWDPQANVDGGARYLRDLVRMFGGDVRLALAAYNAGESNVVKAGYRVPAFEETRRYVPSVLARQGDWSRRIERIASR
jgi:soluble lytic murein transglycosylase-like protein